MPFAAAFCLKDERLYLRLQFFFRAVKAHGRVLPKRIVCLKFPGHVLTRTYARTRLRISVDGGYSILIFSYRHRFRMRSHCVRIGFRMRSHCVRIGFRMRSHCVRIGFWFGYGCGYRPT